MSVSEQLIADNKTIAELQRLVSLGEGQHLEFKRKANYPEKIVQEMIAFANAKGGNLLLGVDDNKQLAGVKFPEEESHVIRQGISNHCRPAINYSEEIIPLSTKRYIIRFHIPQSEGRPHYFVADGQRESFVREGDMCIKASREMKEIIRRSKSRNGVRFTFGDHEKALLNYLQEHAAISLIDFKRLVRISRFQASRKLILLVLAKVLIIKPTEKGDFYHLA
jgi:predicted HTH transcriptional regulator